MNDRIYEISRSGLTDADDRMKQLMNDVVNARTPGFKKSESVTRSFALELEEANHRLKGGEVPRSEGTFFSHIQGALVPTKQPWDLTIGSDGFFVLQGPQGLIYTRDGRFRVLSDGSIVSVGGNYPLLGSYGPVVIDPKKPCEISGIGEVRSGDEIVNKIRISNFENVNLLKSYNGVLFYNPSLVGETEVADPKIVRGYLEAANANIAEEMMNMYSLRQQYNFNAKVIEIRNQMLSRAQEMSRVNQ